MFLVWSVNRPADSSSCPRLGWVSFPLGFLCLMTERDTSYREPNFTRRLLVVEKKLKVYIPVMSYTSKSFSTSTMFRYLMKINPHLQQPHSSKYLSQLNRYKGIFQVLTQQFSTVQKALKLASRAQELAPSEIMLVILKPIKHL